MNRALAVVTQEDGSKQLVREAGTLAAGCDAELVLLWITPSEEYERRRKAVTDSGAGEATYTIEQAEEAARRSAMTVAHDLLSDLDLRYEVVGMVGRELEAVLDVADDRDCDHLFVAGPRRTPTGKALFGDLTQQLTLAFDGPVTVLLGDRSVPDPASEPTRERRTTP
jgi:nucleotide-binding universal stress UspA family protein